MLELSLFLAFGAVFALIFAFVPAGPSNKATLGNINDGLGGLELKKKEKKGFSPFSLVRKIAVINKPFVTKSIRSRVESGLRIADASTTVEEFFLYKQLAIIGMLFLAVQLLPSDMVLFGALMAVAIGYMLPEFWLKGRISRIKDQMVRELPDAVDLLGLCVNAGLDFMMALKWVVEKAVPSVVTREMNNILQEISVGKPRRDALRDLSKKYQLSDLSTFTRTLIQADKMGTSVSEALNILSEDMRLARYRRGEAMALKAPLKMLVPLLFFIFPVVGILVAGPIFIDFMTNNPLANLGTGQ